VKLKTLPPLFLACGVLLATAPVALASHAKMKHPMPVPNSSRVHNT